MSWIQDIVNPQTRKWEDFYRNRFQHDKIVRSTHGVNCTGSCSWQVAVKDGIVVWETQHIDYPEIDSKLPGYEPRGCQRGISFSWYLYSPIRIKYPLIRGALLDAYREEKQKAGGDPMKAWENLQANKEKRISYQHARGRGGFRRASWDEVNEIMSNANIYTAKKYGPDRVIGFSPIPAMSMLSYAAGSRFLQLFGAVNISFYDWYCDLPPSYPEIWGEQTDCCESADWYNAKMIIDMGANLNMTRTPDAHFFAEARHNGTKTIVCSPDFSMVSKFADQWVPLHAGSDGAFWQAITHVLLKEFYVDKQVPYFIDYLKKYSDVPYLVKIEKDENGILKAGRLLRANELAEHKDIENGEWKFIQQDSETGTFVVPKGSMGHRWDKQETGKWNMKLENSIDDKPYDPLLSFIDDHDEVLLAAFDDFGLDNQPLRGVPVKYIKTTSGEKIAITTTFDVHMAQYGVPRGLEGAYPTDYTDKTAAYTPAWQEIFTGVDAKTIISIAREWGNTGEITEGKNMVIVGAGINHWYHQNLMYRAATMALIFTGSVGKNGGGINHYVGQEKLAPVDAWSTIALAKDWNSTARLQQGPIWHYMNTDQYRYDTKHADYNTVPDNKFTRGHMADDIYKSVRMGHMPFYPQFNKSSLELASQSGAKDDDGIKKYVLESLKDKSLGYAAGDVDAPENFPRVWYIWRGNAIGGSMKGQEYCAKHYLGTNTDNITAKDQAATEEVKWHDVAPVGKMDLVIDLNFRMDSSALYSDIVLPSASWYEKADINSTDMHSFIHPLGEAIPPVWEAKTDWEIFSNIAKSTSEVAKIHLPGIQKDVVTAPLVHDTADEITQPTIKDWFKGECEAIPGKTMHKIAVQERDYTEIYDKYIRLGPNMRDGAGAHGSFYETDDVYDEMIESNHFVTELEEYKGKVYPSLKKDISAIDAVLHLSSVTNGKLSNRAYKNAEKKTGLKLKDIAKGQEHLRITYKKLTQNIRRYNTSPVWSGLIDTDRAYAAYTYNVEKMVPWRTLTGRQHTYIDHELYIAHGEHLPTYKPSPNKEVYGDLRETVTSGNAKVLSCLTPHGKWHIHSTYMDNIRMLTLSRGIEPCWISEQDAADLGINDNDWVEVVNDNGVYTTRACVSSRIPKGVTIVYHTIERTIGLPLTDKREGFKGGTRSGGNNAVTRVRLKPNLLAGGYGQFTYYFNYWGPVAVNRDTHVVVRKKDSVIF
jgi:nitrate reductase alpha subunit